jgi:hypothetical protein
MTGSTISIATAIPQLRLLERLETILTILGGLPREQHNRRNTNQALAARGQAALSETELRALRAFGRNLPS